MITEGIKLLSLLATLLLFGCELQLAKTDAALPQTEKQIDETLRQLISRHELTGDPTAGLTVPDIHHPRAQLGMLLFFSKALGGERDTACASCHHPFLGGGDDLSLPIGVGAQEPNLLGPGRKLYGDLPVAIPRNSPTTFNIALWRQAMFHDGRIQWLENEGEKNGITTPDVEFQQHDSLSGRDLVQAQARFPIISADEMRGGQWLEYSSMSVRRQVAGRLKKNWTEHFRKALGFQQLPDYEIVTEQNISALLADYESSQIFVDTPWKAYVEGDKSALPLSAKRGALLFFKPFAEGGANCVSCHSGDFFTDEKLYNTAIPQIGTGKGSGLKTTADTGFSLVTLKKTDEFKFRTPSLLNVEVTGPWGHNGAYTSLEAIITHMLSPIESARNYDPEQLQQTGIYLKDVTYNTEAAIKAGVELEAKPDIQESDITALLAFMKALTDPCVKSRKCLSKWIPPRDSNDPDGLMLHAVNAEGDSL